MPVRVGLGGHTNHSCCCRAVPDTLLLHPTARTFSCSHCHRAGSTVWGDLGGFSCPSVDRAVNVTQCHAPELPDLLCGSVPSSFRPVDGGYLAFPLLSWLTCPPLTTRAHLSTSVMTCKHPISLGMAQIPHQVITPTATEHSARGFSFPIRT